VYGDGPRPGRTSGRHAGDSVTGASVGGTNRVMAEPGPSLPRVIVADAVPVARLAMRQLLAGRFRIVAEVGHADAAVADARRWNPDVCLLDADVRGDALAATGAITAESDAAVVILADTTRIAQLFEFLAAGAVGFLPKDRSLERLADTLDGVRRGQAALPRDLMTRVITEFRFRSQRRAGALSQRRPATTLTPREYEVLDLLMAGCPTADIARRLFVSEATVRTHVAAVLRKLGAADRAALKGLVPRR
jgi:DNA-binding NarL/FixJ family response regulator